MNPEIISVLVSISLATPETVSYKGASQGRQQMTEAQIKAALIDLGVNRYIIEFDTDGADGSKGCHLSFDDMPKGAVKVRKLIAASAASITDKGVYFPIKA